MDMTQLPTTRVRLDLLSECLQWAGTHYDGQELSETWRRAVRHVLGLPLEPGYITRADFTSANYERALEAYGEILKIGYGYAARGMPDDPEAKVCYVSFVALTQAYGQPDLTPEQTQQTTVEAMVTGLGHYLSHCPNGLASATTDLLIAMSGGDPGCR